MPYIIQERRDIYDGAINVLIDKLDKNGWEPGDLNYIFYSIVISFFLKKKKYLTVAEITGVLENVKQEFYRIHVSEYEDLAMSKNGDI